MAKSSKSTSNDKSKKNKNKRKTNPNAVAMKLKAAPKSNPFETIWSRRKFDILGKKRKGEERRVGLARSLAIEKRKKTLLKDYEQSGKSSLFLDKRIGEQNEELNEFDKGILRSQRERQLKLGKKSKYNLSDGEEDELETQGIGLFSEMDDFEDEVPFDDEDDADATETERRSAILKQLSTNGTQSMVETGSGGEEERQKSKKEVMEELVSKSKFFKALRAKDKEESGLLMEQLDEHFTSLVQSEAFKSLTEPKKIVKEKADGYDKLVNEMVMEKRARPSDRTKTPEELAQEEKERLEELEEERRKRMVATDESSDEEGDSFKDDNAASGKLTSISGDDLGDSFSHDEEPRIKLGWVGDILRRENEVDVESSEDGESSEDMESDEEEEEDDDDDDGASDKENVQSEKPRSLKDWELSDDDNADTALEDGEEGDDGVDKEVEPRSGKRALKTNGRHADALDDEKMEAKVKSPSSRQVDLPYTIEAPKSLEELSSLLDNLSDDQTLLAIKRIRDFNSIKLAAENRKKMQVFYGVLLQYFAVSANKKPLNFNLVNLLVKPLMEISVEIPYFAAICARQRLLRTRSRFTEDIKNSGKSCWPSMKTLFLLRLWSMIFPCSDFRHVVMTPAILLMCEYLMRCPILSGQEVAIGSFLCSMVLSVCKQSKKFCPEAIVFLRTLLVSALDNKPEPYKDSGLYHLMELKAPRPLLRILGGVDQISPLDFLMLMDSPEDSPYFSSDNFRASMLVAVVETLRGFVNIYEGFNTFPEMFLPISKLLVELAEQEHMPDALRDKLRDAAQYIEEKTREHHMFRRPLQMRKQKPVPIKLLNPKFEENFVKGRDYDPDRERAEKRKLQKLLKREAKGAARELRKDNYFLSEVKEKDKMRLEEERAEKYGRAKAFLQEQEHAFKSGQLGKGRKRRR